MTEREQNEMHRLVVGTMLAQQWETAKGELRACIAISGSRTPDYSHGGGEPRYLRLEKAVEDFIKNVEDHGWHEVAP